eukprot:m.541861 g.541861  ORF g.541861 m.541861 type:complete len:91 (-) comp57653_c0_seq7:933-1205(-)
MSCPQVACLVRVQASPMSVLGSFEAHGLLEILAVGEAGAGFVLMEAALTAGAQKPGIRVEGTPFRFGRRTEGESKRRLDAPTTPDELRVG